MEEKIYTQKEADELVEQLKKVFSVVRILDKNEVGGELNNQFCCCYSFWGKDKPCVNCTSKETLKDHKDRTKVEVADGEIFQVFCKYLNIEGKTCVLEILKDISNLNIEKDDLQEISKKFLTIDSEIYKDILTNCLNRNYYEKETEHKYKNAGVILVDMDGLKDINDIYGHTNGDYALKSIADVMLKNVREGDLVIRYGGDEFIMIMPNINKTTLVLRLEKIRKEVNEISLPEHENIKLSVSVGAIISEDETLSEAVKKADKLMYSAKKSKNRVVVEWNSDLLNNIDNENKNKLKILIVDDSKINRIMLKLMLDKEYEILEASDGLEAVKIINKYKQNISLILLDIEMPNMGGFEYLEYLNKNDYIHDIPVIIISSDDHIDTILKAYEMGASEYLTRPYNTKLVKQRIDNISKLYMKQRKFKEELSLQKKQNKKA